MPSCKRLLLDGRHARRQRHGWCLLPLLPRACRSQYLLLPARRSLAHRQQRRRVRHRLALRHRPAAHRQAARGRFLAAQELFLQLGLQALKVLRLLDAVRWLAVA